MMVHWIWLVTRQGLNKRNQYALLQRFEDPEAIYRASAETLQAFGKLSPKAMAALADRSLDQAQALLDRCRDKDISLMTAKDAGYPQRLRGISDPPILLYYRGVSPEWDLQPVIGAVGTRRCSEYGIRAAEQLGYELTRCGGCVASGFAQGIDRAVISGALAAGGAPVVFLAGGVDVIYPAEHRELYQDILSRGGCIMSEQPPGVQPVKRLFPVRNRLISGVSNGVLVVEAPAQSGALITARHAREQGRELYAVPGPIGTASCEGSNALLKDGARMIQSGWDILERYEGCYHSLRNRMQDAPEMENTGGVSGAYRKKTGQTQPKAKKVIDNGSPPPYIDVEKKPVVRSPQEQAIVDQLTAGPRLTDVVIEECGLSRAEALAAMTVLEIQGILRRLPGNLIAINDT